VCLRDPLASLGRMEPFNQPAKQAERVLAPGDGEAEPGDQTQRMPSPRSGRQMKGAEHNSGSLLQTPQVSVSPASQAL